MKTTQLATGCMNIATYVLTCFIGPHLGPLLPFELQDSSELSFGHCPVTGGGAITFSTTELAMSLVLAAMAWLPRTKLQRERQCFLCVAPVLLLRVAAAALQFATRPSRAARRR